MKLPESNERKRKTENAQKKPTCLGSPSDDDGGEMCGMQALGNMSYAAQIIECWQAMKRMREKDSEMCSKQDSIG